MGRKISKPIDPVEQLNEEILAITKNLDGISFNQEDGVPQDIRVDLNLSQARITINQLLNNLETISKLDNSFSVEPKAKGPISTAILRFYDPKAKQKWQSFFSAIELRNRSAGGKKALRNWEEVKKIMRAFRIIPFAD